MSAVLSVENTLAIAEPIIAASHSPVARILHLCHTLEETRDAFLEILPDADDETVIQVRMSARVVGVWAWLIECACDAEMVRRVEKRAGRGKKDVNGTGRLAAIGQQAYLDGKSIRTVERNAQIMKTFSPEIIVTRGENLPEKGFFMAAMSTPDPLATIEMFEREKIDNPFFEVQDAWSMASDIKAKSERAGPRRLEPKDPDIALEMAKLHSEAVQKELAGRVDAVKDWPESAVSPLLAAVYRRITALLEWQKNRTVERDCLAVMEVFNNEEGYAPPDCASFAYIQAWLGRRGWFMTKKELEDRVATLKTLHMLTDNSRKGSKGATQRGVVTPVYDPCLDYAMKIEEFSAMSPTDRRIAIHLDWVQRARKYAPELLPKEKAA